MLIRTTALTALLALSGFGFTASAQAQTFGVSLRPDDGLRRRLHRFLLPAQRHLRRRGLRSGGGHDPSSYYGSIFADVGASAEARPGEIHARAAGHTGNIDAKPGFYSSAAYGYGYAYSFDRLTVSPTPSPRGPR